MKDLVYSLRRAGWAPTLVFGAHVLLSCGFNAYKAFPPLDIPMHLLGGVAISFFLWTAYRAGIRSGTLGRPSNLALVTLTFTSTVACALFWEFAEFLSDRYFGTNSQAGLEDTLLDMLLGVVGGAVFVGISWFRQGGSDQSTPGRDHA